MLDQITPVILTYNEAANIRTTLSRLTWAARIVVVDSFSSDETLSILKEFPNVHLYQRKFDGHAPQWRFATEETAIATPWLLRLDADYVLSDALVDELRSLSGEEAVDAYRIAFDYAIFGKRLLSSLYPPNTILLRQGAFRVADAGHTEAWRVDGPVKDLKSKVLHDDRKSLERWIASQIHYMQREREILGTRKSLKTWLREHPPLMPICAFLYCSFGKGLLFQGKAGIYYTLQRTAAEAILSLLVLDRGLRGAMGRKE